MHSDNANWFQKALVIISAIFLLSVIIAAMVLAPSEEKRPGPSEEINIVGKVTLARYIFGKF